MSADSRVVIHLLTLKCGPPLDKESSREEIKLAERMAAYSMTSKHVSLKLTKTNSWKWWKKKRKSGIRKMNGWTWRSKQAVGI
ncbi:unnamed protein product [Heligmosomoides polygyrus]|uniref:Uncharacterized protein n=1 Tax=Heligmosomoides polygyrus TaxID=6339 RepID=A0A183FT99_HELPZ|nr:unnamed protein product [Heligmosomoides polygyrus]